MKPEAPEWLPAVNAALILISGAFLAFGYASIRRRRVEQHRRAMLTATLFAALFLIVYVARAALFETKIFPGSGTLRAVYLAILTSHTILAIVVAPLVVLTLRRALRKEFLKHRRLARLTAPIWAYVVVSGWVIYWMLYHL